MSQFGRHSQIPRPDSRSSQYSGHGGMGSSRFTNALSAALKPDYSRPPLPPTAQHQQSTADTVEEQLEEVEQKITLTLQAIDASFDHSQRTMARDVMPKIERLARLSGDLLQASQPWLQFFMAVAAADEQEEAEDGAASMENGLGLAGAEAEDDTRASMGMARRAAIEEQAHKGDITARFPGEGREWQADEEGGGEDDECVDIDADIATPQLTSRFMTEELAQPRKESSSTEAYPTTPRVRNMKRMAEQLSVSAKKRKLGNTPKKQQQQQQGMPKTPVSMMRALVHSRVQQGSAVSYASKNSSSMATEDLMPDTSPPHTTTFTLPQSRRIAAARAPSRVSKPDDDRYGFGNDDDDDDILDEINSLIKRYDSPASRATARSVKEESASHSSRQITSVARSIGTDRADEGDMTALANKYASPDVGLAAAQESKEEVRRAEGLVADMEEMLDEVEAAAQSRAQEDAPEQPPPDDSAEQDDLDHIPSPPVIASDLDRSRVEIPPVAASTSDAAVSGQEGGENRPNAAARRPAAAAGREAYQPRRTFGGGANMMRMDLEAMASDDVTIGHMSPLANRGRTRAAPPDGFRVAQGPAVTGTRFYSLGSEPDADDPFGPTPVRAPARGFVQSTQSDRAPGAADHMDTSMHSWSTQARNVGNNTLGSDATATLESSGLMDETRDSRLNDSSMTIEHETQSMDGTTSILPTREMLLHAARAAEEGTDPDDLTNASDLSQSAAPLVTEFEIASFPLAFRDPPASDQLHALWVVASSEPQRLWTLDELMPACAGHECMRHASTSVCLVLLDLLARRRLLRKVSDGLWTAH
ncbi:DASH complex subunit ask1 [Coemansia guatemalensis]|uniref:DASH complex subunit ask1 n=1 Tax=Coemansia guatemalensis TaxID=2761395 RepID=A0A9W8LUZ8_9FUNG|nr:DASH complex subunit ask1 [Coemansia guatemalensis]